MNWEYKNFKHQNTYNDDCSVVTAVNAYYFLTGKTIHTDKKYYKHLCELNRDWPEGLKKVHEELGLETFDRKFDKTFDIYTEEFNTPIELCIFCWKDKVGHSILIVGRNKICHTLQVTNFGNNFWKSNNNNNHDYGWIWEEDLNLVMKLPIYMKIYAKLYMAMFRVLIFCFEGCPTDLYSLKWACRGTSRKFRLIKT